MGDRLYVILHGEVGINLKNEAFLAVKQDLVRTKQQIIKVIEENKKKD